MSLTKRLQKAESDYAHALLRIKEETDRASARWADDANAGDGYYALNVAQWAADVVRTSALVAALREALAYEQAANELVGH
jgi:hypothetical protein